MNKKFKVLFLATVIFILGAWILIKSGDDAVAPVLSPGVMPTPTLTPTLSPAGGQQGNTITYTDSGYSPAIITIKKDQTITWQNNSSYGMRTASAIHPTHFMYPTTGGCIGSTFDACTGVASGGTWSFRFDVAGTWKYHNHLNSSHTGTVVVE